MRPRPFPSRAASLAAAAAGALALAGCASTPATSPAPPLDGTAWMLVELGAQSPAPDAPAPTLRFAGERVTVQDGVVTVYNEEHPNGFNPDTDINHDEPSQPTSGDVDTVVPEGTIFVMGDHRQGNFSCDSRNCMGPIPLFDIIGPVSMRIYPFNKIRGF